MNNKNNGEVSPFIYLDEVIALHSSDKSAITFNKLTLSYNQLENNINNLANTLVRLGINKGDVVATLFESGFEATIALLAITKIGAIYAPFDTKHPELLLKKRADILDIKSLLYHGNLGVLSKRILNSALSYQVSFDLLATTTPPVKRNPLDPACIFFTSGTTTEPKAIVGSALALKKSIIEPTELLALTSNDCLNAVARYAWSISMLELLAPLVVGGQSLLLDRAKVLNFDWLAEQLTQCTAFHCPPALLMPFSEYLLANNINTDNIRLTWYGGDTFTPRAINTVQQAFAKAQVGTAYGSTEVFGLSHIYIYPQNKSIARTLIGQPVTGIKQWIVKGELHMGGDRLMLGNLSYGKIDTTRLIFKQGTPYYQTGDYVKVHNDNNLEFIERQDNQIKIRGIRIELGEIDCTVCQVDKVKDSLTLPVNEAHTKRLTTFVIGPKNIEENIRLHLVNSLPEYMLPAQILIIDKFPITENFKVDRKALLALQETKNKSSAFSSTMNAVAALWNKHARINIQNSDDNFFELGGNSMSAAIIAAAITRDFKTRIEVADIYSLPTLRMLAEKIEQADSEALNNSPITNYPASFGQTGLFFRELFSKAGYSITVTRSFVFQENFDKDIVRSAIFQLIKRHSVLRAKLKLKQKKLTFHVIPIQEIHEKMIEVIQTNKPISINKDNENCVRKIETNFQLLHSTIFIKAFISTIESGGELIQLTVHHIAADDNSMMILGKEFAHLYQSIADAKMPKLPITENNFGSFALNQIETAESYKHQAKIIGQRLIEHYKEMSEVKQSEEFTTSTFSINKINTKFAEFIAAISWYLGQGYEQKTFIYRLTVALHRNAEEQPNVGMFINWVPIFCTYKQSLSPKQHLLRTVDSLNEAIERSNIAYETILMSNPELRQLKDYPFDAYLNELSFEDGAINLFENFVIPWSFSNDDGAFNVILIRFLDKLEIQINSSNDSDSSELAQSINSFLDAL